MAGNGGNSVMRMSPRQRMINLMYIVLTAMLALNVSSDVLNGFSKVHASLSKTNLTMSQKNEMQFQYLVQLYKEDPESVGDYYKKGVSLRQMSNDLFYTIDSLKLDIARQADGVNGDFNNLVNQEDLEASGVVMLSPSSRKGTQLRKRIERFRNYVVDIMPDSIRKQPIHDMLTTEMNALPGTLNTTWEEANFENMPAIAAITILTKLQNDVRMAESEAMLHLISKTGKTPEVQFMDFTPEDVKVNEMEAFVIPKSSMVMRGGTYEAQIVLAAVDRNNRPKVYVGGRQIPDGLYKASAGSTGTHQFSGFIEVPKPAGGTFKFDFSSEYTVVEPMATISPTMMNVIYAGIDNPISISVPGVPMSAISASISSGSLTRNGNSWIARASNVGSEATISVSATIDGRSQTVGSMTFRVRKLPDPTAYIAISSSDHYKGAPKRISKAQLLGASGLGAEIDDDIINVHYKVVSFSTIFIDQMGNAIPESSNGASFSSRQMEKFRELKPGKVFFISNIKASGPDGITRDISPIEVRLN